MGRPPKATKRELSDIKVKEETTTTPEPESDLKMKSSPKLPSELGSAKEIYSSALTESHVPAEHRQDFRSCVYDKERAVKHGLEFLENLVEIIQKDTGKFTELQIYMGQAESILALDKLPRIPVGVVGPTGSGKSSFLNALLDEEFLLPTNGMRASTSAAVECSWNPSDDHMKAYHAEYEMITREEWEAELPVLRSIIQDRPEGESIGINSGSEASVASQKLQAVYASIEISKLIEMTAEELNAACDLSSILGQTRQAYASDGKAFSQSITQYIDSKKSASSGKEPAFWPLVKAVRLYLKSPILRNGLVLVDLPGLGDSNTGRTNVTEKYMSHLHQIWIIEDIVRAVDSKIARGLLDRSFQRQLLRTGRYHQNFITFIMTKTDHINTQEVINTLHLDESTLKDELEREASLKSRLAAVKQRLNLVKLRQKEVKHALRKPNKSMSSDAIESSGDLKPGVKRPHSDISNDSCQTPLTSSPEEPKPIDSQNSKELAREAKKITRIVDKLDEDLSEIKAYITKTCIQERNTYTRKRLIEDFEGGFRELEEELKEDDEEDVPTSNSASGPLKTFCISSFAFQKLCGNFARDDDVAGFPSFGDTSIPQLQDFASKLTLGDRMVITDKILNELGLLNLSLKAWSHETSESSRLSNEQRRQLSVALKENVETFNNASKKATSSAMKPIRKIINQDLKRKLKIKQNTLKGWENETIYSKHYSTPKVHFHTWKAICRRGGTFHRKGGSQPQRFTWNSAFLDLILKPVDRPWAAVFQKKMLLLHEIFSIEAGKALHAFISSFEKKMTEICGPQYTPAQRVMTYVALLEDQLKQNVSAALEATKSQAVGIQSEIMPLIKNYMNICYNSCLEESGRGTMKRMQKILTTYVDKEGSGMFQKTCEQLLTELTTLTNNIEKRFKSAIQLSRQTFSKGITDMMLNAGNDALNKSDKRSPALQADVFQMVQELEAAWARQLENPEVQLRTANPFSRNGSTSQETAGVHNADDSDSEMESDDEDAEASDSDSESSGSDGESSEEEEQELDQNGEQDGLFVLP